MRKLGLVMAACLTALLIYILAFAFAVKKPISIGYMARLLDSKRQYAEQAAGPKLIVAAGSNGFFSVRCETMEAMVGRPCVNNSVFIGFGRALIFDQALRLARPGDIILAAFEFRLYMPDSDPAWLPVRRGFLASYDHAGLQALPAQDWAATAFNFDMRYLLNALVEEAQWLSFARRQSKDASIINRQGDHIHHSRARAMARFAEARGQMVSYAHQANEIRPGSPELLDLQERLKDARRKGVSVVGTLPASIDNVPLSGAAIAHLANAYRAAGQDFIVPEGNGQFPRDCFFDTPEHLVEECQIEHSKKLGAALAAWISAPHG